MKKCPYCAEEIQDEAIKCKHCGEFLDKSIHPLQSDEVKAKSSINDGVRLGIGMFIKLPLIIIGIIVLFFYFIFIFASMPDAVSIYGNYFRKSPIVSTLILLAFIGVLVLVFYLAKKWGKSK